MTLGQKIKKLRTEKNLTQKDLADQVHVTFQTVSKWEKDENEPDVSTLRELAKLFDCSLDYLLSEEDKEEEKEEETPEQPPVAPVVPVTQTIIIHQKELHVCERCKKDIPEEELKVVEIRNRHHARHSSTYRQGFFHKSCYEDYLREKEALIKQARLTKAYKSKRRCFGWGIAGGVIALIITLLVLLLNPDCKAVIHPALAVLLSVVAGYGIFAMIYCILAGSYIGEVFVKCAKTSIKFPMLIFSWSIEGFAWLIVMKALFAVIGFLAGVFAFVFATALSAALGMVSFPFVLIHSIHTDYEDAF